MNNIPQKLRKQLASDPFYSQCARKGLHGHECDGRITWDHAIIYGGNQVQERFAIVPVCAKAHNVDDWQDRGDYNRQINLWIALNRATDEEILSISKCIDYFMTRYRLNKVFGVYCGENPVENHVYPVGGAGINYGPAREIHT